MEKPVVYIVVLRIPYEGDELKEVFSSYDKAVAHCLSRNLSTKDDGAGGWFEIIEKEVQ